MKKKPSVSTVRKSSKKSRKASANAQTKTKSQRKSVKKSSKKSTKKSAQKSAKHSSVSPHTRKSTTSRKAAKKSVRKSTAKSVRSRSTPRPASEEAIEDAFRFCPSCQAPNQSPGTIPFRCEQCGFAFFFGPVAAVGGLIVNQDQELLLVRRARDPGKGQWGLPGGFVDRGESIEDALRREVTEETQLTIASLRLLTTGPNHYTYQGVTADVVDLFFVCRVEDEDSVELEPTELSDYRWCVPTKRELNNMAFPSNRIAVEQWLRERKSNHS
ncbi:NUDIX domain-containing protein [Rhodopirellula sp. JC740]|uniref:NUDIX domain-containing protein n=1 Tax=Rhodopirellula halodulae TaxID=2894198 RepID=A0ABS8NP78_9BACT|nr:NUDIX domain-containing protein [Rhodopirellula sp. JC740]MCC9645300.1 NUDIX domain-containing protein [Rhodopirellula sp. JC740]